MKPSPLSALLFLAAAIAPAQVCHAPAGAPASAGQQGIQIPITVIGGGAFVPVVLNDGNTYGFLLDTGFEDSVLDPLTSATLKLQPTQAHSEVGPGGRVRSSAVSSVSRTIGGVPLASSTLNSHDLSGFTPLYGHRLDGILGYDFFHQFVVILDYQHQRLTLCDPATFKPGNQKPIPLHLETHLPYIDTQIESPTGKPVQAALEIDSGKIDPFSLDANFARHNGLITDPSALLGIKAVGETGPAHAWIARTRWLSFGNVFVTNPVMSVVEEDADRAGQIGYGVLRRFIVTFDYPARLAWFEPTAIVNDPYEFDHAGLILGASGIDFTGLKAFMVIGGTPASIAGIRDGDEILKINNHPASAFTLDTARAFFEQATGPQRLTIRRSNSTLELTIDCRRLL